MKFWKKTQILFLAALAAVMLLGACTSERKTEEESKPPSADAGDTPSSDTDIPGEDKSEPENVEENEPQPPEEDTEQEENLVKSWQEIYISVLNAVRAENIGSSFDVGDNSYADSDCTWYQLYDIDKDDIPELFIHYGISSPSSRVCVYTIRDGKAVQIASEWRTTHGSLHTSPNENGVIFSYGYMDAGGANRWILVDGALKSEYIFDEQSEGYSADMYMDIQTVIPGSRPIDSFSIDIDLPVLRYQQIRSDYENRVQPERSRLDDAVVRQTMLSVMENNGMVHGAASDAFASGIGYMAFQEYLGPGMADQYAEYPLHVKRYAWADVNGDGQVECVLHLVRGEEDSYPSDTYAVMSLQGGEVYVYGWSYFWGVMLENGAFASGYYEDQDTWAYAERLVFDGEECFQYSVELPGGVGEAAWETPAE